MKLTLALAEQLARLLKGERIPAGQLRHPGIKQLLSDGIVQIIQISRSKQLYFIAQPGSVAPYLSNNFGINDLEKYMEVLRNEEALRADAVFVSGNSKLKNVRTFQGFPVNVYDSINCEINSKQMTLTPQPGLFTFIYDYQGFKIPEDVTVIGVENPENFRHIHLQRHLFSKMKPLFVSRYPQTKDIMRWLFSISNRYVHFGDFDVDGLNIYWNEYKKHLSERASFFVPPNISQKIAANGNRDLYHQQKLNIDLNSINEKPVFDLYQAIQQHKKGLEQELLINPSGS